MSLFDRVIGEAYDPRQIKRNSDAVKGEIKNIAAKQAKKQEREGKRHPVDVMADRKRPYEVFSKAREAAKSVHKGNLFSRFGYRYSDGNPRNSIWVAKQESPWLRTKLAPKVKKLGKKVNKVGDGDDRRVGYDEN